MPSESNEIAAVEQPKEAPKWKLPSLMELFLTALLNSPRMRNPFPGKRNRRAHEDSITWGTPRERRAAPFVRNEKGFRYELDEATLQAKRVPRTHQHPKVIL